MGPGPAASGIVAPAAAGPCAAAAPGGAIRLFVAADKSGCGKTSVCLGLLGALLRAGVPASELGYIKPATQVLWCDVI